MNRGERFIGYAATMAAAFMSPSLTAQQPEQPAEPAQIPVERVDDWVRDYLRRVAVVLDYTRYVAPSPEALAAGTPVREHPEVDLQWVEVERSRLDSPEPPPPLAPAGLAGLVWALENPAESWRVILPIPPEQAPELSLPAYERTRELQNILAGEVTMAGDRTVNAPIFDEVLVADRAAVADGSEARASRRVAFGTHRTDGVTLGCCP